MTVIEARIEIHVCSNHFKQLKKESSNLSFSQSETEHHMCQIKDCGKNARYTFKFWGYIIPKLAEGK